MTKYERQRKILDIINHYDVETQEELVYSLVKSGFKATQATVSRDIKELGLIKVAYSKNGEKSFHYSVMKKESVGARNEGEKLLDVIREVYESVSYVNNLVVLKSKAGTAGTIAAVLDSWDNPGKLGTIAGDDTLLIIMKSDRDAEEYVRTLESKLKD